MPDNAASSIWESGGYPPTAFYFSVVCGGTRDSGDSSFQEVSGIGPEMETESYAEGGENRFVYQLPKTIKHPKLILKRGIAKISSPLVEWCMTVLEGGFSDSIEPKLLNVYLLNESADPIRSWSFADAYPVQWEIEGFNSTKNQVAIETIKINYTYSKREQ
jgi:phage tail-like protein